jgi:hypothetical protein
MRPSATPFGFAHRQRPLAGRYRSAALMAIYHACTKPLSRSSGRSAVAAAAYRSGELLIDHRQGVAHDYTRRTGVVGEPEIVLPASASEWASDREKLWNAAEFAESRKDSRTAREWVIALPSELAADERRQLALDFALSLADRYGVAVDVAIHKPDREGDSRNHHAHLLTTTRTVGAKGLGDKSSIEWSDARRLKAGMGPGRVEIDSVRQIWEQHVNGALEHVGRSERVDHRSLEAQWKSARHAGDVERADDLDRTPTQHLGPIPTLDLRRAERTGEEPRTERAQQHIEIVSDNLERRSMLRSLRTWFSEKAEAALALLAEKQAQWEKKQALIQAQVEATVARATAWIGEQSDRLAIRERTWLERFGLARKRDEVPDQAVSLELRRRNSEDVRVWLHQEADRRSLKDVEQVGAGALVSAIREKQPAIPDVSRTLAADQAEQGREVLGAVVTAVEGRQAEISERNRRQGPDMEMER